MITVAFLIPDDRRVITRVNYRDHRVSMITGDLAVLQSPAEVAVIKEVSMIAEDRGVGDHPRRRSGGDSRASGALWCCCSDI